MIIDFNKGWNFAKAGMPSVLVNLPHDAMLSEKRDPLCHNGKESGFFPGGKYLYEKNFLIETETIGKYIALHFEGVYRNATILINDQIITTHSYGYTEFTVDISEAVKVGSNKVTVLVDNSLEPNSRWYSGSGIYRPVSLMIKEKVQIKDVRITTITYKPALIKIEAAVEKAIATIYEGNKIVAEGVLGEFTIPDAKLWNDEHPFLYKCVITTTTDEVSVNFGIRKLEWSAKTGFLVNGEEVLLRGGCIHHDNGVLGACAFKEAEERRVRIMKEAGYNAIRSAHNPCSRAMLDACDKYGMYMMDEAYDGWYTPKTYHDNSRTFFHTYQDDLAAMVEKDRNHPCVVMYSIGNEVSETVSQKGVDLAGEMKEYIHSLDDTRPVTCGINVLLNVFTKMGAGVYKDKGEYKPESLPPIDKVKKEKVAGSAFYNAMANKLGPLMFFMSKGNKGDKATRGVADKLDIIGLNYASSRYNEDAKAYPKRMMVGSETLVNELPYNWRKVNKHKAIIGDFVWTAFDYIGEAGIGAWYYHSYPGLLLLAGSGTIDITGYIGAESYYQQIVWGLKKQPYLCVRPVNFVAETPTKSAWRFTNAIASWNWRGYENQKAVVEVFADAHSVELKLNGRTIGTKKIKNYKVLFTTKYNSGTLTAIAKNKKGNVISEICLKTGSEKTVLQALPEKVKLKADGQDLCYLPIEFVDTDGNVKPAEDMCINISVAGAVTLQGFGSALCKTDEVFDKTYHNTFQGRALAVLRAGYQPGKAIVIVSAKGYEPVTVELCVE